MKGQNITSGPANYAVAKTLLKGDVLMVFEASETFYGAVTLDNLEKFLDNVTTHVFLEKSVQTQTQYMRRNICSMKGQAVKEWVTQLFELNKCLREFSKVNRNAPQN